MYNISLLSELRMYFFTFDEKKYDWFSNKEYSLSFKCYIDNPEKFVETMAPFMKEAPFEAPFMTAKSAVRCFVQGYKEHHWRASDFGISVDIEVGH